MYIPDRLDPDLEGMREALHKVDDDKLVAVQRRRNRKEVSRHLTGDYSLTRLLNGMRMDSVARTAPYEQMVSDRLAEQIGRPPHPGYAFVPVERRDLTVASSAGGGFLVPTDVAPGNTFVHFLDQFFPFERLGITRLTLQRPAVIPGITGTISTSWLATEGSTITESQFVFAVSATSPKMLGAYCEVSRQFLEQTSTFAQSFVMQALARAVTAELSRKLLVGTGAAGQIDGVFGAAGVTGLAAGSANYSKCLDCIEAVESNSAMLTPGSAGFVMPANIAKMLRGRELSSGSGPIMRANDVSGYLGIVTQGCSPNSMTFADWSQLCLLEYNVLEIGTDPYGATGTLFRTGSVGIRALWTIDSILLNPKSFVTTGSLS